MNNKNTFSIKEVSLLIGAFLMIGYAFTRSNAVQNQQEQTVVSNSAKRSMASNDNESNSSANSLRIQSKRHMAQVSSQQSSNKKLQTEEPSLNKIWEAERCISEKNCDYPKDDPRAYSLTAYKKLSEAINENRQLLLKEWNPQLSKKISDYFNYSNGYVKESLLDLVKDLPNAEASRYTEKVINEVLHYHDAELIPETLTFLQKQMNSSNQKHIYSEIGKALAHGSPQVSEALAQNIDSFLNSQSIPEFKNVAQNLPEHSPEKTYLDASIKEYEMRQSGG